MLADLGLSKDLALASGLTVGAGTAGFAPPEQRDAAWIDPRADIWSASALVVWLATGQRPEDGHDWPAQLHKQGWPGAAADELARGLSHDAADRHPSAEGWQAALHAAIDPPAPVIRPDPGPPAPPPPARRRLVAAAVAIALLAVLGGGWWVGRAMTGDRRDQRTETVEGGRVRVSAADGGLRVAAVGPASVEVGTPARFVAEVDGASQFVWIAPNGRTYTDAPTTELRPQSEGEARVFLTGVDAEGNVATVEHRLVVAGP